MEIIATIGVVLSILTIIYLAMNGISVLIAAPIAAVIVIITNQMDFFPSLIGAEGSYMSGLTEFIINFFAVFLLGAILANYINVSGAAQAIAGKILKKMGTEKPYQVLLAVYIITALLTYGGISLYVVLFVLIPLAKPLFKRLNIAWNIAVVPMVLGFGTFTMSMLPGTPSVQNAIPTGYLGTTLTAAPFLGLIGTAVAILTGLWYMKSVLDKSIANGETFADFNVSETEDSVLKEDIPTFFESILPLISLIVIILVGSALEISNILLIGLSISIVIEAITFNKYIPSHKEILNVGAMNSISPIFLTSSAIGFGAVITNAPGFHIISKFILGIPGSPLISLSAASILFASITGSASGSIGIVLQAFGQTYLDMGIPPEVIHRVTVMASAVLTNMPHSGIVLTLFALTGLNHKNAYKYVFNGFAMINLSSLIIVCISAVLLY